ncbi:hypothetical protein ABES02_10625 [Neobacillus pocheonensis]|uniref:hypothetical protein n=1 Tax=Neobacillus pocheonensis TaxID=363869 RepID=UPI003D2D0082
MKKLKIVLGKSYFPSCEEEPTSGSSFFVNSINVGKDKQREIKGGFVIFKNQEKRLSWLAFIVAFILGISIIGRIFSG